jgi:hypothetical protein
MDPVKLSGIRDWPTPNMVKQVQGLQTFIDGLSRILVNWYFH